MNSSAIRSPMTSTRRLEKRSMSPRSRSRRSASPGSGCTDRVINIAGGGVRMANCSLRDCLSWLGRRRLPHPAGGRGGVVGDRISSQTVDRAPFLGGTAAGADQDRSRADGPRQLDVAPSIADDERPRQVETQIGGGAIDQTATGLPARTPRAVCLHAAVRVVRTIII